MKSYLHIIYFFALTLLSACGMNDKNDNQQTKSSKNQNTYNNICTKSVDIIFERALASTKLTDESKKLDSEIKNIYSSYYFHKDQKFAEGVAINILGKTKAFHEISLPSFRDRLYSDCKYNIQNSNPSSFEKNIIFFNSNIQELKAELNKEYSKINTTNFTNDSQFNTFKKHIHSKIILTLNELNEVK